MIWIYLLGGLWALACLLVALKHLRRKRLIDDLPTSKAQGVFIGQCELKGTAESDKPFTSFLAGRRCVWYKWTVEEYWSRITMVGSKLRHESGWEKVAGGGKSSRFYLKDDTGLIRIAPKGAELETTIILEKECTRKNSLYYDKGPARAVNNSKHRRRFREIAIPLHAKLYVTGHSRERTDVVAPEIAQDKNASLFVISTRTEKLIARSYIRWFWCWLVLGMLATVGTGFFYSAVHFVPVVNVYMIAVGGYLLAFCCGWVWMAYNSLVRLGNLVHQGWSQIDVQLKRRSDLLPQLVECVTGYRNYEREWQMAITELRTQAKAQPEMAHAIGAPLAVIAERHPDLKADESFRKLQEEIISTEQRIALARAYFNNVATFYNTRLERFPDHLVATLAGLKLRALWQAEGFERAALEIKLSD